MPYVKESGVIFAFYATGVLVFLFLATYHISETQYLSGEEGVVVPMHVIEELELAGKHAAVGATATSDPKSEPRASLNEIKEG